MRGLTSPLRLEEGVGRAASLVGRGLRTALSASNGCSLRRVRWLVLLMLLAGPASAGTLIDSGGGAALARALTARIGAAVRVARLHVYAGSAWADVAAAGTPSGVRRYEWRDGTLREIALDSTAAPDAGFTIDDHLFALAEVPLDAFAPLARAAVEASKLVRAEYLVDAHSVTKVRGVPFTAGELEAAMLKELGD